MGIPIRQWIIVEIVKDASYEFVAEEFLLSGEILKDRKSCGKWGSYNKCLGRLVFKAIAYTRDLASPGKYGILDKAILQAQDICKKSSPKIFVFWLENKGY